MAWDCRSREWRHQEGRRGEMGDKGRGVRLGFGTPHTIGVRPYPGLSNNPFPSLSDILRLVPSGPSSVIQNIISHVLHTNKFDINNCN